MGQSLSDTQKFPFSQIRKAELLETKDNSKKMESNMSD